MKSTICHLIIRLARISNRKTILVTAIVFVLIKTNVAQNIQINPSIQSTNGGHTRVGNFSLDYTIGEPVYTPLVNGNLMLTQGFQQPEKPLPPVVPALQAVCSDTAHTFTFSNVRAGAGGDLILWSLHSNFDTSYAINSGNSFSITVNAGQMDTIWLKSRYSGNGFASESVYTVASVSPFPLQKTIYAKDTLVLKDSSTQVLITNSQNGVKYLLKNGSVVVDSAEGTGDTLWLNTKAISANAILRVIAKDTITGCFVQLTDTFQVNIFPFLPVRHGQRLSLEILLNQPAKTFFQIKADADAYIDSLRQWENLSAKSRGEEPELQEDGEEVHYGRWLDYWSNRIDSNGSANRAVEQMSGYLTGIVSDDCSPSEIDMKWKCLGPFSEPSSIENQGRITAIEVDPADPQTLFAGSSNGGVWKTADGGAHWFNCTDSSNLGGIGIGSIAINPNQRNHIVAATGKGSNSVWATTEAINYSIGAIESLDGGNTWHTTPLTLTIPQNASPLPWGDLMTTIKVWYNPKDTIETWYGLTTIGLYRIRNQIIDTIYETARNPHCLLNGGPDSTYLYPVKIVDMLPDKENGKIFYLTLTSHWEAQWCPEAINPYNHEVWKFDLSTQPVTITKNIASTIDLANSSLTYFDSVGNAHHFATQDIKDMVVSLTDSVHSMLSRLYIKVRLIHDTAERVAIFYSDNGGATWNTTPKIQQTQMQDGEFVDNFGFFYVSPKNENVVYGNTLIPGAGSKGAPNRSTDGGETYLSLNNSRHADLRAFNLFNPSPFDTTSKSTSWAGDGILIGNDGGICIKPIGVVPDTSTGFHHINGYGLAIGQYYGLGNTEKDINTIIAGALDGSISAFVSKEWNDCLGAAGDRGDCLNQYGTNNWIEEANWNQELRNRNNGACNQISGWGITNNTLKGPGVYSFMPMTNYDRNRNEYYIGYANVYRTTNLNNDSLGAVSVKFSPITDVSAHASNNYPLDGYRVSSIATGYDNTHNRKIIYYSLKDQYRSYYYTPSGGTSHLMPPTYGIYKSEDDGVTWVPKDSGLYNQGPLDNAGITDIAVDKNYADHIFISFGRFSIGNKVFESIDGGNNWHNISGCLPNFPVNSLIYQPEADRIIAGTDVGVYYRDIYTDSMWVKMAGLPDVIVLDMELHNCGQKLQIATYGRSIWEADLPPLPPYTLATDETWNSSQSRNETVIIPNGYVLHITGSSTIINMARGTSIIVEPGAKLQIDNDATVTNGCGAMWGGIIVKGDPTQAQEINHTTGMSNQGYLETINATIENAYEAVRLWDPDWTGGSIGTGGIVQATTTTFKNNRRSAEFMQYHHWLTLYPELTEAPNPSFFIGCNFLTNDNHSSDHPFSAFVTAWSVAPVGFYGCTFENRHTITSNTKDTELGDGIKTIDAGVIIDDIATSEGPITRSLFKNLQHGVNIATAVLPYGTRVFHAQFENCLRGIRNEGVNLCTFVGNDFTMGANAAQFTDANEPYQLDEGIILHQCTGFIVEQNTFTDTATTCHPNIGIRSDATGTADNRIYKNTFTSVRVANLANRQNQNGDQLNPSGLHYECNENTENELFDICVSVTTNSGEGVRARQGELTLSAGNTFVTTGTPLNAEKDFYNAGVGIDYYHDGVALPVNKSVSVNTGSPARPANDCNANYTLPTDQNPNDGGCNYCLTLSEYSSNYSGYKTAYNNYLQQYLALIDGGNTQARLTMVDTITNSNRLKDSLNAYNPNLSSKVLGAVVLKYSLLNDTAQYYTLKANAEGVTFEVIKDWIKWVHPPQWMLDSIIAAQAVYNLRSYLQDSLTHYAVLKQQTVYSILRLVQQDTSGFNISLYRTWLDSVQEVWAKREMVNTYLFEGKLDTIETLVAHYDTLVALNDSADYSNYKNYVLAYNAWIGTDTSVMRLDSAHVEELKELAEIDEHKKGTNAARNILNFFYDSLLFTPAMLPDVQYNKKGDDDEPNTTVKQMKQQPKADTPLMKLYPNPAQNTITIEYTSISEGSKLFVSSVLGIVYEEKPLNNSSGKIILNTSDYSNGLYLARIENQGKVLLKNKFIIQK